MRFPRISLAILGLSGLLLFSYGCSHPDNKQEEEVSADQSAQAAEAPEGEDAELKEDEAGLDEELTDEEAPANAVTDAAAAEAAAAPAAATAPMNEDRVVRYVLADNTPVYEQADDKSKQVGTYQSGDPLVVKMTGEWSEVSEGVFIRSAALSDKLVPRKRPDAWNAH